MILLIGDFLQPFIILQFNGKPSVFLSLIFFATQNIGGAKVVTSNINNQLKE